MSGKEVGYFILWIISSMIIPFGALGELLYRHMMNISLKKKPGSYVLSSLVPFLGPIISKTAIL